MNGICPRCARRAWLLTKLSAQLDFRTRGRSRLWPLLALPDAELIDALGGRRRHELQAAYAQWQPTRVLEATPADRHGDIESICRHRPEYPGSLRESALAPHTLSVRGGIERLATMLDERVVAIVGTRRASDYGMETARDLARGLAASGLTIVSGLADGIPAAAHSGALEADGSTLTVMAAGVERCSPAWCRALYRRITSDGCAISEVSQNGRVRRWWQAGRARTIALLAQLVIVVEAGEQTWELDCAHVARAHGRSVAAVPGRVSSRASMGTNAMLMEGARLVRGPQDALDILYGVGVRERVNTSTGSRELESQLRAVLERVSDGEDTVAKLTAHGARSDDVALALAELELRGLLLRGDAGRYLPSAGACR